MISVFAADAEVIAGVALIPHELGGIKVKDEERIAQETTCGLKLFFCSNHRAMRPDVTRGITDIRTSGNQRNLRR